MTGDELRCYRAEDRTRMVVGRHRDECGNRETCRGCLACWLGHCADCGYRHVEAAVVCDTCLGRVRDSLGAVRALYAGLLFEAMLGSQATRELPGGDATVALGPWSAGTGAPDDDRWDEWRAYSRDNHVDSDWHPVLTLESWGEMWREWCGQQEPVAEATLTSAVGYLDPEPEPDQRRDPARRRAPARLHRAGRRHRCHPGSAGERAA